MEAVRLGMFGNRMSAWRLCIIYQPVASNACMYWQHHAAWRKLRLVSRHEMKSVEKNIETIVKSTRMEMAAWQKKKKMA